MNRDYKRTLSSGRAGFPEFLAGIEAFLDEARAPSDVAAKIMIAFDELVSNILDHGTAVLVTASLTLSEGETLEEGEIVAELTDDGGAFNPLARPDPDTSLPLEHRPAGGLGIHIVRKLMDHVEYSRDGNCNRLRFAKNYPLAS